MNRCADWHAKQAALVDAPVDPQFFVHVQTLFLNVRSFSLGSISLSEGHTGLARSGTGTRRSLPPMELESDS